MSVQNQAISSAMHLSYLNCVNCEPASFLSFCFRRSRSLEVEVLIIREERP